MAPKGSSNTKVLQKRTLIRISTRPGGQEILEPRKLGWKKYIRKLLFLKVFLTNLLEHF